MALLTSWRGSSGTLYLIYNKFYDYYCSITFVLLACLVIQEKIGGKRNQQQPSKLFRSQKKLKNNVFTYKNTDKISYLLIYRSIWITAVVLAGVDDKSTFNLESAASE